MSIPHKYFDLAFEIQESVNRYGIDAVIRYSKEMHCTPETEWIKQLIIDNYDEITALDVHTFKIVAMIRKYCPVQESS